MLTQSIFVFVLLLVRPLGQVGTPEEVEWIKENAQASEWLQKGRYAEAAKSFSKSVQLAEKFGADDERLGESLNGLAEAYRLQENYAGLGSVHRRILSIRWSDASRKGDPAIADLVDRFADVLRLAYFPGPDFEQSLKKYQEALAKTPAVSYTHLTLPTIYSV